MIHVSPSWLEIAIVAGIAIVIGGPVWLWYKFIMFRLRRLNGASISYARSQVLYQRWASGSAFHAIIVAPLWEELLCRALPYWLVQQQRYGLAGFCGLVLNVVFALAHKGDEPGWPNFWHRVRLFACGILELLPLYVGLLSVSVFIHALWNITVGGVWRDLRDRHISPVLPGGTMEVYGRGYRPISVINID